MIIKFNTSRMAIFSDQIIRFDNRGNCVIVVAYTHDVRVIPVTEIKSISPVGEKFEMSFD